MVLSKDKKGLRREFLAELLSLTKDEIKRRSENVEETLSKLPIYKKAKCVMVYYPLRGEVDLLRMVKKDKKTKRFCFPVIDLKKKDLIPFEVSSFDGSFTPGPLGVTQPDLKKGREVDPGQIDLVVIPGLAFDDQRNRLGRGRGFYDRFLKKIKPPAKKIGVAFVFQITANLPAHPPLDEKVDFIVSEGLII